MSFNKDDYISLIRDTLNSVALDQNSILSNAEEKIKNFLETNTSITDNEKAQVYTNFLTNVVTSSIQNAIQQATNIMLNADKVQQEIASMQLDDQIKQAQSEKDLALKDAQINETNAKVALIEKQQEEITQKIASMQLDDQIKQAQSEKDLALKDAQIASMEAQTETEKNRVAGELAKIKYEVEHYLPAQVDNLQKDLQLKDKELELRSEQIELQKKEIDLKQSQITLSEKEAQLKEAQIQLEKVNQQIAQQELQIKQTQIPLVQAQTEVEKAKAFLIEQQGKTEQSNQTLVSNQAKQVDENINKIKKEIELLDYQKDLTSAERNLKDQQATAVLKALDVNKEIEKCKCETQLKVAELQTASL